MKKHLGLVVLVVTGFLAGCSDQKGGYVAASSLSKDGFARNAAEARKLHGQEVKLWGFVDHGNLYGDEGAKQILGDRWSGAGPNATTWRFNLKGRADDEGGIRSRSTFPTIRDETTFSQCFLRMQVPGNRLRST